MNIVVFVKRVADTEARIRVAQTGTEIDPSGIKYIVNPYDEFALEAALRVRETRGSGKVTVLALGGSENAETLRGALALGADDAILLLSDQPGDSLNVARTLAGDLRDREFDLALFGMKAIDDDQQAVGPMVAELLDLPAVTAVSEFTVEGERIVAQRAIEGGVEIVDAATPCVLTITKGAYEPRYASLKGIMAAKKKPIEEKAAEVGESATSVLELSYPPERNAGRIVGEGAEAVSELVRLLREEARVV